MSKIKKGFTLAEMMVVMLILSIVLAAMAPVMPTRNKTEQTSPWRYSEGNLSDAYYGLGVNQTAMIGQREFETTDEPAKLIINANSKGHGEHIAFKFDRTNQGVLRVNNNSILLGSLNNGGSIGTNSVAIGSSVNADENSIAIGKSSKAGKTSSVALGYSTDASGENTTVLGASSSASGNQSTAVGVSSTSSGTGSIAIGHSSTASAFGTIALGSSSSVSKENSTAIGYLATSSGSKSTAIGSLSSATADNSTAIGISSTSNAVDSLALGKQETASGSQSIALGKEASATNAGSVAMGFKAKADVGSIAIGEEALSSTSGVWNAYNTAVGHHSLRSTTIGAQNTAFGRETLAMNTTGSQNVAVGNYTLPSNTTGDVNTAIGANAMSANLTGSYNTALGYMACSNVTGSNKTCIGANSGPSSGSDWATDDVERVFIGGKPKFNDGAAVLEVHNTSDKRKYRDDGNRHHIDSTVVVNGNLIVKGFVFSTLWTKGGADILAFYGHDDDQMEYFNVSRDNGSLMKYYGESGHGYYKNGEEQRFNVSSWSWSSDKRLKYLGTENTSGLDKIRQLKIFNYTFKKDKTKTPHVGVIAQDLQKIFPDAVTKGKD